MPLGPKNLKISFTGKNVTHFGGIYLLHLFFKRIKLKSLFSKQLFFLPNATIITRFRKPFCR